MQNPQTPFSVSEPKPEPAPSSAGKFAALRASPARVFSEDRSPAFSEARRGSSAKPGSDSPIPLWEVPRGAQLLSGASAAAGQHGGLSLRGGALLASKGDPRPSLSLLPSARPAPGSAPLGLEADSAAGHAELVVAAEHAAELFLQGLYDKTLPTAPLERPLLESAAHWKIAGLVTARVPSVTNPYGIWLLGGAGSGKGLALRWLEESGYINSNFAHLDVTRHREFLGPLEDDPSVFAAASAQLNHRTIMRCLRFSKPFVVDGIFGSIEELLHQISDCKQEAMCALDVARHYDPSTVYEALKVIVIVVGLPVDVALRRTAERCAPGDPSIRPEFVMTSNEQAKRSFEAAMQSRDVDLVVDIDHTDMLKFRQIEDHQRLREATTVTLQPERGRGMEGLGQQGALLREMYLLSEQNARDIQLMCARNDKSIALSFEDLHKVSMQMHRESMEGLERSERSLNEIRKEMRSQNEVRRFSTEALSTEIREAGSESGYALRLTEEIRREIQDMRLQNQIFLQEMRRENKESATRSALFKEGPVPNEEASAAAEAGAQAARRAGARAGGAFGDPPRDMQQRDERKNELWSYDAVAAERREEEAVCSPDTSLCAVRFEIHGVDYALLAGHAALAETFQDLLKLQIATAADRPAAPGAVDLTLSAGSVVVGALVAVAAVSAPDALSRFRSSDFARNVTEALKGFDGIFSVAYSRISVANVSAASDDVAHLRSLDDETRWEISDRHIAGIRSVANPYGIWLAGGAGSGKGHVLNWLTREGYISSEYAHLDVDTNRAYLPLWWDQAYIEEDGKTRKIQAVELTQPEASKLNMWMMRRCLQWSKPFVFDSTFRGKETSVSDCARAKVEAKKAVDHVRASSIGCMREDLKIIVIMVETDLPVARSRVADRAKNTGRPVQAEFVKSSNLAARHTVTIAEKHPAVDLVVRIENNAEHGTPKFKDASQIARLQELTDTVKLEQGTSIVGLGAWLRKHGLQRYEALAERWCMDMGAISVQEILENWEEFADALALKPLERKRLQRDANG